MSEPAFSIGAFAACCVERMQALEYKGKARDRACLDYFCGAATLAQLSGDVALYNRLSMTAVMIVSVRGYLGVNELATRPVYAADLDRQLVGPVINPPEQWFSTHRTGRLSSTVTPEQIETRIGFPSEPASDDGKVKWCWHFLADGEQCGVWDYRGARWSTFGPRHVFEALFPTMVQENEHTPDSNVIARNIAKATE